MVGQSATLGRSNRAVAEGDVINVLRYVGEGYWKIWADGATDVVKIRRLDRRCVDRGREVPCTVQITKEPTTVWWARIRDNSDREGWTRALDRFGGIDSCA